MTQQQSILVVDDEPGLRKLLNLLFSNAGYVVREASNGAECLNQVVVAPPDLVVLDDTHVDLADRHGETLMDAFLFNCAGRAVKNVMVGGNWVVREGRHHDEEAIEARYRKVQKRLLA